MSAEGEQKATSDVKDKTIPLKMSDEDKERWKERAKSLDFYDTQAAPIAQSGRTLLEEYSKIPVDKVDEHAQEFRKKAFAIFPYPCIGMFRFLDPSIKTTASYPEILARVKAGEKLLDLGCCIGQEIRQLVHDGAPPENLFGSDLRQDFMDIGYDLFLDKQTLNSTFIPADVFDDESELVKQLAGKISVIHTGSFFHLFGYEQQVQAAKRCIQLLKQQKDGLILGKQMGNVHSGTISGSRPNGGVSRFKHNEESWKKMWAEVSEATGVKLNVEVTLDDMSLVLEKALSSILRESGTKRLRFVIRTVD